MVQFFFEIGPRNIFLVREQNSSIQMFTLTLKYIIQQPFKPKNVIGSVKEQNCIMTFLTNEQKVIRILHVLHILLILGPHNKDYPQFIALVAIYNIKWLIGMIICGYGVQIWAIWVLDQNLVIYHKNWPILLKVRIVTYV